MRECLDIYNECINDIVAPDVGVLTNIDIMKSPWVVYSNNMLDCGKKLTECNELDNREIEREYALLKQETKGKSDGRQNRYLLNIEKIDDDEKKKKLQSWHQILLILKIL